MTPAIKISVVALAGVLGGCATTSVDRNFNQAQSVVQQRFGVDAKWLTTDEARREAAGEVDRLLQQPLSADDAVRIALAYSPSLQTMLFDSAAVSATSLSRRGCRTRCSRSSGWCATKAACASSRSAACSPSRCSICSCCLRACAQPTYQQQQAGWKLQPTSCRQRSMQGRRGCAPWRRSNRCSYVEQVKAAADASAELARRMQAVGNFSKLQRAREQAFSAEAVAQLARAQQRTQSAREVLVRALGLDEARAVALKLPDRLPDLPAAPSDENAVVRNAIDETTRCANGARQSRFSARVRRG